MKPYKLKCKLQHNFIQNTNNDERPELGKSYSVIDVKKIEIKNTNKSFFAFKFKEFEHNEICQWFPEDLFDLGKNKITENFVEII
jgi:hypothetical protein